MIDPEDPFERRTTTVLGHRVRYVDEGSGPVILLLNGGGAFSYQWRNLIRMNRGIARCIAPDLVGLGHSAGEAAMTNTRVRIGDVAQSLMAFTELLGLGSDIVVVAHELGAALGAHWAMRVEGSVAGFVSVEGVTAPIDTSTWPADVRRVFEAIRSEDGRTMVLGRNAVVEEWIPANVVRHLPPLHLDRYRNPYASTASRHALLNLMTDFPTTSDPGPWVRPLDDVEKWLRTSNLPKLAIIAERGLVEDSTQPERWRNVRVVHVGGGHIVMEDSPAAVTSAISRWLAEIER